jgi:hypothetical protein
VACWHKNLNGSNYSTKTFFMPNPKVDEKGFSTSDADVERDIAGKGGPAIGAGNPDAKHAESRPYDEDLQTQIAAKGTKGKKNTQEQTKDEE